jgi:hypothetical protein
MAKIIVLVPDKPTCAVCQLMPTSMGFDMIPDGTTTILLDFEWLDRNGHRWPAPVQETWVPTAETDVLEIEVNIAPILPPSMLRLVE